jgi:sugar phosphate isomerase/epimerase
MQPKLELGAISDEFSPDPQLAFDAMAAIGMTAAELRVVWGRNIMDLTDEEVVRATELAAAKGIRILGISSPLVKCVLPGGGDIDTRYQQDIFGSKHSYEDQPRLADRAMRICELTGARLVRVFSYWRTVTPEKCFEPICETMVKLANLGQAHGITIGIENEHACNVGLAVEARKVLDAVPHEYLKLVWDPANGLVGGEEPFPYGYRQLPVDRIAHVHAKDCHMEGHKPIWGPVGTRHVDWKGQIAALLADGYRGAVHLETHWAGPGGDKMMASTICGWNLRGLLAA